MKHRNQQVPVWKDACKVQICPQEVVIKEPFFIGLVQSWSDLCLHRLLRLFTLFWLKYSNCRGDEMILSVSCLNELVAPYFPRQRESEGCSFFSCLN